MLINRSTIQCTEVIAAALHDIGGATLVGERSYGYGEIQGISRLDDGSAVSITIAYVLTPKDEDINRVGLKPDIVVPLSEVDYKTGKGPWWWQDFGTTQLVKRSPTDGKDIQLAKAIQLLLAK